MAEKRAPIRLTEEQRFDWLRLIRSENVGPRTFRALVNQFAGARAALEALPELARRGGARRPLRIAGSEDIEQELIAARRAGVRFVALGEPEYPEMLRQIESAPPILALRGREEVLQQPAVAIVGSRNASAAGLAFTERLGRALGEAGYVVVSGLARGIDMRAHMASLGTGAIGVLAGGHARPYPPEAIGMIPRIAEFGAVISEMPIEWEPRGRDFPRRNRIVSGLSLGVIVVEAARGSGSLITARFAGEQGREVMAVPGSPLDPRAEGCNDLLRDGARICARVEDAVSLFNETREHHIFAESRRARNGRRRAAVGRAVAVRRRPGLDAESPGQRSARRAYAKGLRSRRIAGRRSHHEPAWPLASDPRRTRPRLRARSGAGQDGDPGARTRR